MTVRGLLCLSAVLAGACAPTVDPKAIAKAKIHYDIAVTQMNHGDMRSALRELLAAERLDPELSQAQNALGLVFHSMGRKDEAREHYRNAVRIKPKFSEAHNNLGVLLIDMGQYAEAIGAFKVALSDILYATPSLAEGNMGWAYYKKGEVEPGVRHLKNAVATNPKFCRGYLWLARIYLEQEKPADAVRSGERFEKYCFKDQSISSLIPQHHLFEMRYYRGVGHLEQGARDAAREAFAACATGRGDDGFGDKCAVALDGLR